MSSKKITDLQKSQLTMFREQIMSLSRRLRREIQNEEWTLSQILILGAIERNGNKVTPSFLAEGEEMTSSNVATILRGLEAHQLITREKSKTDKRLSFVMLTDKGKKVLQKNRDKRETWLSEALAATLTKEEITALMQAGEFLSRVNGYKPD